MLLVKVAVNNVSATLQRWGLGFSKLYVLADRVFDQTTKNITLKAFAACAEGKPRTSCVLES